MDNKYIEQLRTQVKDALRTDNMRYQHTLGVANTSACLAMCHGADMNKAYIAGFPVVCHWMAEHISSSSTLYLCVA